MPAGDVLKQALGVIGGVLAVVGVITGNDAVIWTAVALLGLSLVVRLLQHARRRRGG